jgi:uncharacterized protein (DUF1800 family)
MFRAAGLTLLLLATASAAQAQGKAGAQGQPKQPGKAPVRTTTAAKSVPLTGQQRALHALNRLTFGPRPGDVEKVMAMGVDKWIEQQLKPEEIEDSAVEARLAPYRTTRMKPAELVESFPPDGIIRAVADGKKALPKDPLLRLVYSVQVARVRKELQKQDAVKTDAAKPGAAKAGAPTPPPPDTSAQDEARQIADRILALPKGQRMAALAQEVPEKLINFPFLVRGDQRDKFNAELSTEQREAFYSLANPQGVVASELQHTKVLRGLLSERQLQEVMTDFWFNHFNVFLYKNNGAYMTGSYERDVIRPNALGKFHDLLVSTAHHPAMLNYLDNWLSEGPDSPAAKTPGPYHGLNENYGRELMELHTLGVDGGYSQNDVTELARILTGWTIRSPELGGEFAFDPRRHQPGSKTVLGQTIEPGGENEGLAILYILSHHPATAHFISKKLAQRFLADDPPEAVVKRMAAKFLKSDGDIREVLRTLFASPEFWSMTYHRAKLKTPLEFVLSAVRASGTEAPSPDPLVQNLNNMGMPLYQMQVPTGYAMKAESWDNTGALVARLNFSIALTAGKIGGLRFDPLLLLSLAVLNSEDLPRTTAVRAKQHTGADLAIALMQDALIGGDLSKQTETTIRSALAEGDLDKQMANSPAPGLRTVTALVLGSPEFQRR